MKQSGRVSAASLAVAPQANEVLTLLQPPEILTAEQKQLWREIVATKPAEWFTVDYAPLLMQYVREVFIANTIAEQIDNFDLSDLSTIDGLERYKIFVKLTESTSTTLKTLATTMRLTPQSRWQPQVAANQAAKAGSARKVWEQD